MKDIIQATKKVFRNILGDQRTPGQQYEDDMADKQAKINAQLDVKEKRQKQIAECTAALKECRATFSKIIRVENALASEMSRDGFDTGKQKGRVREAAIGILVIKQALYELQSISSESDMNNAMNKMGMALLQLRRLDNSTSVISKRTEQTVREYYPTALKNLESLSSSNMEIPEEMRARIDEAFVTNLMEGDDFDICMLKSSMSSATQKKEASNYDKMMAEIEKAAADDASTDEIDNNVDDFRNRF